MDSGNTFFVGLQGGPPWGFRLQGGREYRAPLSVTKVSSVFEGYQDYSIIVSDATHVFRSLLI